MNVHNRPQEHEHLTREYEGFYLVIGNSDDPRSGVIDNQGPGHYLYWECEGSDWYSKLIYCPICGERLSLSEEVSPIIGRGEHILILLEMASPVEESHIVPVGLRVLEDGTPGVFCDEPVKAFTGWGDR